MFIQDIFKMAGTDGIWSVLLTSLFCSGFGGIQSTSLSHVDWKMQFTITQALKDFFCIAAITEASLFSVFPFNAFLHRLEGAFHFGLTVYLLVMYGEKGGDNFKASWNAH